MPTYQEASAQLYPPATAVPNPVAAAGAMSQPPPMQPYMQNTSIPNVAPAAGYVPQPPLLQPSMTSVAPPPTFAASYTGPYGPSMPSSFRPVGYGYAPMGHYVGKTNDIHGYARLTEDPLTFTVTSVFPKYNI